MTSDRDALIAACMAEPCSADVRLVFADWLDEHGEEPAAARMRELVRWWGEAEALAAPMAGSGNIRVARLHILHHAPTMLRLWPCLCVRWLPIELTLRGWFLLASHLLRDAVVAAELHWSAIFPSSALLPYHYAASGVGSYFASTDYRSTRTEAANAARDASALRVRATAAVNAIISAAYLDSGNNTVTVTFASRWCVALADEMIRQHEENVK